MEQKIGAEYLGSNTCNFCVWAPFSEVVSVIFKNEKMPVMMDKEENGYWKKEVKNVFPGSLYKFRLNSDKNLPDPASRAQPEGVHSWSQVIEKDFNWTDHHWKGIPVSEMIIYELHVGTFTKEGTFDAIIPKINHLKDLGINTIEIMPIAQFPGSRNWGYDGVFPFAVQNSYGGPDALKNLIDVCHQNGIAVLLDVVYNHLGPEGNYMNEFGPYFTSKYETPWGKALNFDDRYSDEVRNYFLQNALMWLDEFHFDGLRLDAVHEIIDRGANHFLKELSKKVDFLESEKNRHLVLIAESDLNDRRIIDDYEKGGYGLEGQWMDDFHHALHTLLTSENNGYYSDYGKMDQLEKSFKNAFIYDGIFSKHRKRTIGNSTEGLPYSKFVVCIQNHDQVGNRMLGERISQLVNFEKQKLAAAVILISPFVPMLFMGEEFGETRPFQYFVSHGDPDLVKAVQEGRKREFKYFLDDEGEFPDPQSEETFQNSKLNWNFETDEYKSAIFRFYKNLISLRKNRICDAFRYGKLTTVSDEKNQFLSVYAEADKKLFMAINFSGKEQKINLPEPESGWKLIIASADMKWKGPTKLEDENIKTHFLLPETSLIICES